MLSNFFSVLHVVFCTFRIFKVALIFSKNHFLTARNHASYFYYLVVNIPNLAMKWERGLPKLVKIHVITQSALFKKQKTELKFSA